MAQPSSKRIPPYLPFKTFLNSLDTLSQGVPPKLDRSCWKNQSGINQGLIMSAYRFFGLIDANDASTEYLATLALHPDKRPTTLRQLINDQYMFVLKKDDITKSTTKMLESAFEAVYPVTGDTKQKAITFFLKAAKFADMPLSPYLLTSVRNAAKKPRRIHQKGDQGMSHNGSNTAELSQGLGSHSVQLAGGGRLTITISANPFTMPADDRSFFFSLVDMLHKYGKEHPDATEGKDEQEQEE
jgi:hypothetical protein